MKRTLLMAQLAASGLLAAINDIGRDQGFVVRHRPGRHTTPRKSSDLPIHQADPAERRRRSDADLARLAKAQARQDRRNAKRAAILARQTKT
jgi:hypothetical protein